MRQGAGMAAALLGLVLGVLPGGPGVAQEGPEWEVQRCVWRCLANSRGADDPAYDACVASRCDERTLFGTMGPYDTGTTAGLPTPRAMSVPAPVPTPAPAAVAGAWQMRRDPELGEGAILLLPGGGSVGLTCSGLYETPLAFRWTAGLLPGAAEAVAVIGPSAAIPMSAVAGAAAGMHCSPPVAAMVAGQPIGIVAGRALGAVAGGGVVIARPDGSRITLRRPEEAAALGGIVIPTAGASALFQSVIGRCPGTDSVPGC